MQESCFLVRIDGADSIYGAASVYKTRNFLSLLHEYVQCPSLIK
jgi:hypothetical protein